MAQVRMKTMMAGPNGVFQPGEVIEVGDDDAQALIEGGYAVAVAAHAPRQVVIETATVPIVEKAVSRTAPGRKGRK